MSTLANKLVNIRNRVELVMNVVILGSVEYERSTRGKESELFAVPPIT